MNSIKTIFRNRWTRLSIVSILYLLLFVVWTENLWFLLGLPIIFDAYISKWFAHKVWIHNKRLCEKSIIYKTIYEWVNAILFATIVASLVHIYFFQMYVIPSSSMEHSLLVGDYLCVSKVAYGPQMPNTPIAFPFVHHTMPFSQTKKSFSEAIQLPYHRLSGRTTIQRNDVVVFNFPAGDTVVMDNQAQSYYDILRGYQAQWGIKKGREKLYQEHQIISRPVDKRENYIKRCVSIAGDSLLIRDGVVWINGEPQKEIKGLQYLYSMTTNTPLNQYVFEKYGITEHWGNGRHYEVHTTPKIAEKLQALKSVDTLIRYTSPKTEDVYPNFKDKKWSADNYGPIWIPQKGKTIQLSFHNFLLYRRCIEAYEKHHIEIKEGKYFIDGEPRTDYTFEMDYYWMMGDNRHNSADSRYWGFVPEDHIVGKASFTWLSLDPDKKFPANIRWSRMFRQIK